MLKSIYFIIVDGNWGDWSNWDACSVTCGSGSKSRSRSCDNPAPVLGGNDCAGDAVDQASCDQGVCSGKRKVGIKTTILWANDLRFKQLDLERGYTNLPLSYGSSAL